MVYDATNFECMRRLKSYWMPRISKVNDKVPVIYVGNKCDLRTSVADNELNNLMSGNYEQYKQVLLGLECSAKD